MVGVIAVCLYIFVEVKLGFKAFQDLRFKRVLDVLVRHVDFVDIGAEVAVHDRLGFDETHEVRVDQFLLIFEVIEVVLAVFLRIEDSCFRADLNVFGDLVGIFRVRLSGVLDAVDADFSVRFVNFFRFEQFKIVLSVVEIVFVSL